MSRTNIEHKICAGPALQIEYKADGSGAGTIKGYAATFGNKDRSGDIIVKGAFLQDLPDFLKDGMVLARHGSESTQPIATPTRAYEDEKGLWVEAEFHSTPLAQDERTIAMERAARGKSVAFSIGYTINKDGAEYSKGARLLKSIKTWEISLVNVPANPQALAAGVKEDITLNRKKTRAGAQRPAPSIKGMFEEELADRTNSLYNLFGVLCDVLCMIDQQEDMSDAAGIPYDYEGNIRQALSEFTERVVQGMLEEEAEEEAGEGMTGGDAQTEMATMGARFHLGLTDGSGMAYAAHLKAVTDAAGDLVRRTEARLGLLKKQGRMLSAENELYLAGLADNLDVHANALRDLIGKNSGSGSGSGKAAGFDEQQMEMKRKLVETALRISGVLVN